VSRDSISITRVSSGCGDRAPGSWGGQQRRRGERETWGWRLDPTTDRRRDRVDLRYPPRLPPARRNNRRRRARTSGAGRRGGDQRTHPRAERPLVPPTADFAERAKYLHVHRGIVGFRSLELAGARIGVAVTTSPAR
jgi:hypothetical protein